MAGQRFNIAKEILTVENKFIESMNVLTTAFQGPLNELSRKKGVGAAFLEICTHFNQLISDIQVIKSYNEEIRKLIPLRVETWSEESVLADIFLKLTAFLKT